jgi:hypothetical protein
MEEVLKHAAALFAVSARVGTTRIAREMVFTQPLITE